ncbi:hypothetical protein SAMN04488063_0844 [Halopelagius inordinatus]|uniref:Halobacterial output domain-containing protein n=1 Tax=Halopelagius inordinatus TaxID=553467 RepID=A0A1I2MP30_9EURY|nr:HalOD1 output domain-containing protein [Halopelagius inordinatus]SFF93315.1 hypothetical protein SAMN04488063_0844 [Halopelagius inordinatus]
MSETQRSGLRTQTTVHGRETVVDAADYDTVSMAIVAAVAAAEGVTATALPPLYDAGIDPDAVNELFGGSRTHVESVFSFTYCDYVVTITSNGGVTVETYRAI